MLNLPEEVARLEVLAEVEEEEEVQEPPTKKKAKAKKDKKGLSDDADPCAYEIDFSVDRSRWVEVHVCTGEERAVRRSMVPCTEPNPNCFTSPHSSSTIEMHPSVLIFLT